MAIVGSMSYPVRDLSLEKLIVNELFDPLGMGSHIAELMDRWDEWKDASAELWIVVGEPKMEIVEDPAIDAKRLKLFWRAAWMGPGEPPTVTHFVVPTVGRAAAWGENFV